MNILAASSPNRTSLWRWLAGGLVLLGLAAMLRFWHPVYGFTSLIQLDPSNDALKVPSFREHPVYVHQGKGGYDGLYYAQIATDPTLRDPALRPAMDNLPYRARRILAPALAWCLGFGKAPWVVNIYSGLNIAFWLCLAALLWQRLPVKDRGSFLGFGGLLFSAGVIGSFRFALSDLPALTLVAAGLFAIERARPRSAIAWLGLAALARETSVLAAAGLQPGDGGKPALHKAASWALRSAAVATPLVIWLAIIRLQAGPGDQGWTNFHMPFSGWLGKARESVHDLLHSGDWKLMLSTLLSFVGLSVQLLYLALHRKLQDPWWRVGAIFIVVGILAGTPIWEGQPGAITRVLLPLQLACCVLMVRGKASFIWLGLANLGVLSGLLFLSEVPRHEDELAADSHHGASAVLHVDKGWYPIESLKGKHWIWTQQGGAFEIETWPKSTPHRVRVILPMRALSERKVVARCEKDQLAQFTVGLKPKDFVVDDLEVKGGRLVIELISEAKPLAAPESPDRLLGFCVMSPRIEIEPLLRESEKLHR